jgi:hypothetical protein
MLFAHRVGGKMKNVINSTTSKSTNNRKARAIECTPDAAALRRETSGSAGAYLNYDDTADCSVDAGGRSACRRPPELLGR